MYFKYNDTVYDTENDSLEDFIRGIYGRDDFDNLLDDEYGDIDIFGNTYTASEIFKEIDESAYETEFDRKVDDIIECFEDSLNASCLGDEVYICAEVVTVCDENGNTEAVKPETVSLAYSSFEVVGGEDKVLVFETEQEVENEEQVREMKKYKVEIPLSVFKEVAKQVLF